MSKIGVLGAGSWGIALATVLDTNGNDVTVWSTIEDEVKMLSEKREHTSKLPGVKLGEKIVFTTDIEKAVVGKEIIVMAVPSVFVRSTAEKIAPLVKEGQIVVDVAKGIEEDTLLPMTELIESIVKNVDIAILSGPSHAEEVGRKMPTTIVAGSKKKSVAEKIQQTFMNEYFRVYTSPDVLGIGLGGSLKNVIALAAGMADGLGCGDNTKAALITRGIREISALAIAMGACAETVEGLSGMGDLIVTCASVHSRNRKAGMLMGQGKTMKEATEEVQMVVEGIYSAKAAKALSEKYNVETPIIDSVNQVLFEDRSVKECLNELMNRDRKSEHTHLKWEEQ
ncbi:MAG: NAD(P)-dependent glycerol-3-phosphate dehydrogenase [Eubacterium sp.]|nr:NAD(P)-dependent glycerol-3-phosphate dehydrogenase [Eubacterium sp.]